MGDSYCVFGGLGALFGDIAGAEADADFFEEGGGRFATGKDPDEIVGNGLLNAFNVEDDGVRTKFDWVGIEENFELSFADEIFDALGVAVLDARKSFLTIA